MNGWRVFVSKFMSGTLSELCGGGHRGLSTLYPQCMYNVYLCYCMPSTLPTTVDQSMLPLKSSASAQSCCHSLSEYNKFLIRLPVQIADRGRVELSVGSLSAPPQVSH